MKAFVTGATGYLGGQLCKYLKNKGWIVATLNRNGNYLTTEQIIAQVREAEPDCIFHCAARVLSVVETSQVSDLVRSNVELTTQLAEAACVNGVKYFINVGTTWVNYESVPCPVNLYAATKAASYAILHHYSDAYGLRVAIVEPTDIYGPDDTRPKLFKLLRDAAVSGGVLKMSPGGQVLNMVYVDDVCQVMLDAFNRLMTGAGFLELTAASPYMLTLRKVVAEWKRITGKECSVLWSAKPYRVREVMFPTFGCKVAEHDYVSLEDGIRRMEGIESHVQA